MFLNMNGCLTYTFWTSLLIAILVFFGFRGVGSTDLQPCVVQASDGGDVAVRVGPGTPHAIYSYLADNEAFSVVGYGMAADGATWWQIEMDDGARVWVAQDDVSSSGLCETVPEVDAPPTVEPPPTVDSGDSDVTPSPTATATATIVDDPDDPTNTPLPTTTATSTATSTSTATRVPSTNTPPPPTATRTATRTATPTNVPTIAPSPTSTPTPLPVTNTPPNPTDVPTVGPTPTPFDWDT